MGERMKAWQVVAPGPIATGPMCLADVAVPEPGPGELLVRVRACGVCRTDLHVAEGDLPVHRPGVVPGHEVVGEVVEAAGEFRRGDRVGIAWLRGTCGQCRSCLRGAENLCAESSYTGWDADGGYAEFATVPADYAYRLAAGYSDAELAPLLCAGIIGYRALRRARLPTGGRLGLYGFGASAHLAAQVALAEGAELSVLTRSVQARELASELGATYAGAATDLPAGCLDAAILFAPAGELVPTALRALDRGGTLVIAGIHLSDVPELNYRRHLFGERDLRSVESNTRDDGASFLRIAAENRLQITTQAYPLHEADRALSDLAAGRVTGAGVLLP